MQNGALLNFGGYGGAPSPLLGADLRPLGDGERGGDVLPEGDSEDAQVGLRDRVDGGGGGDLATAF